jgi:hypothetical protein
VCCHIEVIYFLFLYAFLGKMKFNLRYRPGSAIDKNRFSEIEDRPHEYTPIFSSSSEEKLWQKLFKPLSTEANNNTAKIVNIFTIASG